MSKVSGQLLPRRLKRILLLFKIPVVMPANAGIQRGWQYMQGCILG